MISFDDLVSTIDFITRCEMIVDDLEKLREDAEYHPSQLISDSVYCIDEQTKNLKNISDRAWTELKTQFGDLEFDQRKQLKEALQQLNELVK